MNWRSDEPATLFYVEALDGGDPKNKADYRDAVYQWKAPFTENPALLAKSIQRYANVIWGNQTTAVLQDQWYDTRNEKTYLINPSKPDESPRILSDRNFQDVYSDPGGFETRKNEFGKYVLSIENNSLFLIGEGHTRNGQFPFIDELSLKTGKKTRLYQSAYPTKWRKFSIFRILKKAKYLFGCSRKTNIRIISFAILKRKGRPYS